MCDIKNAQVKIVVAVFLWDVPVFATVLMFFVEEDNLFYRRYLRVEHTTKRCLGTRSLHLSHDVTATPHTTWPHTVSCMLRSMPLLYVDCILLSANVPARTATNVCSCTPVCAWQIIWELAYAPHSSSSRQFVSICYSNEVASSYHPADIISWWCESAFLLSLLGLSSSIRFPISRYTWRLTFEGFRSV